MLWNWDKSRWAGMGITSYSRSPGSREVRPGCNLQLLTRTHPWQTHSNHPSIHLASTKVSSLTVTSIPICKLETYPALVSVFEAYPAAEKHQLPLQRSESPPTCSQHVASTCGLSQLPLYPSLQLHQDPNPTFVLISGLCSCFSRLQSPLCPPISLGLDTASSRKPFLTPPHPLSHVLTSVKGLSCYVAIACLFVFH